MGANLFTYASASDLKLVFQDYFKYTGLSQITSSFKNIGSNTPTNTYTSFEVYGLGDPEAVYGNGSEYSKVGGISDHSQWVYTSGTDTLTISVPYGQEPNDDIVFTIGLDRNSAVSKYLVEASDELNSKIDKKYPRPLPKSRLTPQSDLEYDAIIKRLTCLICAKNMIRSNDPSSEESLIYDQEAKEIIEGLNNGSITLNWESDPTENGYFYAKYGNTSTIDLESVKGEFVGNAYDICVLKVLVAGGLGVGSGASIGVYFGNSDRIGSESSETDYEYTPTGSYDHIGNGLKVRFSQLNNTALFVVDDEWHIPLKDISDTGGVTNSAVRSIELKRNR